MRITTTEGGLILFPENEFTLQVLRRTQRLEEKVPKKPRLIIKRADRHLELDEISWSIKNQNPVLALTEEDVVTPIFKNGPRDGPTVNWVIEVSPTTFAKLENKVVYLGLTKCKMKLWSTVTQCFRCLTFGHTAASCKAKSANCKNCAGEHNSRDCPITDSVKCINCKKGHKGTSSSCQARALAERTSLRRTDFGTCTMLAARDQAPAGDNVIT